MERLGVSEPTSVLCVDAGSSVMLLGTACVPDPGGRSWGPGFSKSSFQESLGRGMFEYF